MTELQRDKTFEPSGVQGKLKIVLHDVSASIFLSGLFVGKSRQHVSIDGNNR